MHLTFAFITGPEIAVVVGLAILLFGADRIPKLARSMGEAKKEFEAAQRAPAPPASPPDATRQQSSNVPPTSASDAPPSAPPATPT